MRRSRTRSRRRTSASTPKEKRLKAQFAAMETALQNSQTQQAWLTGQLAAARRWRVRLKRRALRADYLSRSSVPSLRPEVPLSAYAASQTAAYKQQSILTATPGQLVVMLYDGCLRFLIQAAYAMREGDQRRVAGDRLRRAEAIIDELHATLDMEQGGVIASRLQGIYVFCSRHLLEAAWSATRDDRQGRRAPRRAARRLGPDRRRRLHGPLGRPARARRAPSATLARRGPLGGARGLHAPSASRLAATLGPPPAAAPAWRSSALAVVQQRAHRRARSPRAPRPRASSAASHRGRGAVAGYARRRHARGGSRPRINDQA